MHNETVSRATTYQQRTQSHCSRLWEAIGVICEFNWLFWFERVMLNMTKRTRLNEPQMI